METLYSCHFCKNKVPRSQIRYSRDGSKLVCRECHGHYSGATAEEEKLHAQIQEHEFHELMEDIEPPETSEPLPKEGEMSPVEGTQASKRVTAIHGESVEKKSSKRVTFLCVHCRYKFTLSRKSRVMKKCPYCGKTELLEVTDVATQDLIPN